MACKQRDTLSQRVNPVIGHGGGENFKFRSLSSDTIAATVLKTHHDLLQFRAETHFWIAIRRNIYADCRNDAFRVVTQTIRSFNVTGWFLLWNSEVCTDSNSCV